MTRVQWDQVRELFHQALDREHGERGEFLRAACADAKVVAEVESLLAHGEDSGDFLNSPAIGGARESIQAALSDGVPAHLEAGALVGPYRIVSMIGSGGMGTVYRALDIRTDRTVALKVFADGTNRSGREARAVAALNHPHICTLYDVGPNYLVMEHVEGKPLQGPLPLSEALRMAIQLADVLDAAHRKGIVHRDLKPANILVTKAGVKVLDFGLATMPTPGLAEDVNDANLSATWEGQVVGTLPYMSPEQLQGKAADGRSDVFAFGCVLYELLAGSRAFAGENSAVVIAAILDREPPPVRSAPANVERVLRRCLAKNPDDRWQSARDLKIELEWIAGNGTQPAFSPTASSVTRSRKRIAQALAAVVVGTALLAAAGYWNRAPAEPPLRKFQFTPKDLGVTNLVGPAVISPDGRKIAYTDGSHLFVWELDQQGPLQLTRGTSLGSASRVADPFWSPDSQSLAFVDDGKLWRILIGGRRTEICRLPVRVIGGAWGTKDRIVFAAWRGDLWEVSALGGDPKPLGLLDSAREIDFHDPSFLPGGRDLLYSVHPVADTPSAIEILSGGKRRRILERKGWSLGSPSYSPSGHLTLTHRDGGTAIWAVPFSVAKLEISGSLFRVAADGNSPTIANDGTMVYVTQPETTGQLVLVGRDGKVAATLGQPQPNLDSPAFSSDGKHISFAAGANSRREIWIYDVTRGTGTRLTGMPEDADYPAWLPGDGRILFAGWNGPHNFTAATILIAPSDGSGYARELWGGVLPQSSAGGHYLTYTVQKQNGNLEVWYRPLQNGQIASPPSSPVLFTHASSDEMSLRISPDERYGAYVSNETGRNEIYIKQFPGGEQKRQVSANGGVQPVWSRRGDELFYIEDGSRMMSVPVSTRTQLVPGKPHNLFPLGDKVGTRQPNPVLWPSFDVTPDGKSFVMVQRADQARSSLIMVENWFAEFNRKP